MTSFCPLRGAPPSGRAAPRVLRAGLAAPLAGAAFFLRPPLAGGAGASADCFLRAGTGRLSVVAVVVLVQARYNPHFELGTPFTHTIPFCRVSRPAGVSSRQDEQAGRGTERAKGSSAHGL